MPLFSPNWGYYACCAGFIYDWGGVDLLSIQNCLHQMLLILHLLEENVYHQVIRWLVILTGTILVSALLK